MINTSSGKRILGAAVAEVKNYGLSGVHRTLQLGKQGPVLVGNADTDSFTVTLQDAATLTTMGGANATSGTHFITKSQLDSVYTEATFLANVNYNDTSPILLGNISSGTKTIITTFEVTTAFDANAIVTVGDASDNSLLMSDNYAEIEVLGTYQTINTVEFASNSALNIYVTQGGATQGAGTILVSVVDGPVVNAGAVNYGSGSSGIALTDLSVTSNSPSGNGSLTYNDTTGVFTFTPADASLSNYSDTNVVTLLGSFGSNSISTTGNVTGGYFIGNGSQLTGIASPYTNSNVVTLLSSFGSNSISTTGNVTANNFIGNISITGNVTGTSQNVSLVAGAYSTVFDNTGNTAFANGTVSLTTLSATGNVNANIVVSTNNGNGTNFKVGDDAWLGDVNTADTVSLRGQQNPNNGYIVFGNADTTSKLGRAGSGPLTYAGDFSVSGNITGNTAGFAIGYRDIPQVSFTGSTTIATTDAGKHFYSTQSSNFTLTIANNASQGFQIGAAITVVNQGTGTITIAQGSGVTLYLAGNATASNRSVATFGMATIMKVATNTWFINGTGVS